MQYPTLEGRRGEGAVIRWSDGTEDILPREDGDGETIFELPQYMEEIFNVEFLNCNEGQTGQFADNYPTLFRSPSGVLVLRASSPERFQNAFVCKSRDAADCLVSWLNGEVEYWLKHLRWPPEGSRDNHWAPVKEFVAFAGLGLLDDCLPMIFDPEDDPYDYEALAERLADVGVQPVDLDWWTPPLSTGPSFAYPAAIFARETYSKDVTNAFADAPDVAMCLTHRLSGDEWERLVAGAATGSIASRIVDDAGQLRAKLGEVLQHSIEIGPAWIQRWWSFY